MATMNTSSMFFDQPGPAIGDDPAFLNFANDADEPSTIDPQLAMPLFGDLDEKSYFNSSIWDTPMTGESPMPYFGGEDAFSLVGEPTLDDASDNDRADSASTTDTNISRPLSDKSQNSSKSSVTSVSSGPSQGKKRTRRPTEKVRQLQEQTAHQQAVQQQPIQQPTAQPQTARLEPAQPKPKPPKRSRQTRQAKQSRQSKQKEEQEAVDEEQNDPKRSKFLERNRLAAFKCRQKKKQWMHDLEDTKSEMEKMHANLHREYNLLLNEVSQMKTQLMMHSACNDHNIDQWIKMEADHFIQKSTTIPSDLSQPSGSEPASRRPSQSSTSAPLSLLSPTLSIKTEPFEPKIKEEINYDYMPAELLK